MASHTAVSSVMAFALLASAGIAVAQTTTGSSATTTGSGAQSTSLGIMLKPTERLAPGTQDALMTLVIMRNGTANSVQTSSLPLSVAFGGSLEPSDVSDCRVRDVMDLATPLNMNAASLISGTNTFSFPALTIDADSTVTLAITCDIAADAPIGGTAQVSITPGAVPVTMAGSQTAVTPVAGQNLDGTTGATSGTVTISASPTTPFIPGVPNTGSGGQDNLLLLAISGAIVAAAAAFLVRRRPA